MRTQNPMLKAALFATGCALLLVGGAVAMLLWRAHEMRILSQNHFVNAGLIFIVGFPAVLIPTFIIAAIVLHFPRRVLSAAAWSAASCSVVGALFALDDWIQTKPVQWSVIVMLWAFLWPLMTVLMFFRQVGWDLGKKVFARRAHRDAPPSGAS